MIDDVLEPSGKDVLPIDIFAQFCASQLTRSTLNKLCLELAVHRIKMLCRQWFLSIKDGGEVFVEVGEGES